MRRILGRALLDAVFAPLAGLALLAGAFTFVGTARAQSCTLAGDIAHVSVTAGGVQRLSLTRGAGVQGDWWLMVGSLTGTSPADPYFASAGLHLAWDAYTWRTYRGNSPFLRGGIHGFQGGIIGHFDGVGQGSIDVVAPPSAYPFLVGRTVHHGYYMLDAQTLLPICGSNTVALTFTP